LREFLRVLKPGGWLLLRVAAYEWLRSSHDNVIMTCHRYGKQELRNAAMEAGLQPLRLTCANTVLFPVAFMWRMLKKAGWVSAGSDVRATTRGNERLNRAMTSILRLEGRMLRRINFGFGLSIYMVAAKPGDRK
jgi:hypothetical protein